MKLYLTTTLRIAALESEDTAEVSIAVLQREDGSCAYAPYKNLENFDKVTKTALPAIKSGLRHLGYDPEAFYISGKGESPTGHMSAVQQLNAAIAAVAEERMAADAADTADAEFEKARGHNSEAMDEEGGLAYWDQQSGGAITAAVEEAGRTAVEIRIGEQRHFEYERALAATLHVIAGAVPSSRARARVYDELKEALREEGTVEAQELLKIYESKNLPATLVRLAGLSDRILEHRPDGVKTARTVVEWFDQERNALAKALVYAGDFFRAPPLATANSAVRDGIDLLLHQGHATPLERVMLMENMALPSFDAWYTSGEDAFELDGDGRIVLRTNEGGTPLVEALYLSGRGDVGNELLKKVAQVAQTLADDAAKEAEPDDDGDGDADLESVVEFASMSEEERAGIVLAFLAEKMGISETETIGEELGSELASILSWTHDGLDYAIDNAASIKQTQAALIGGAVTPYAQD